jgi:hypothetical protein
MAKMVHNYLTIECKIDFNKCRDQSYDNAANMSDKYKGMQEIILKINKYAMYIPCAGHSLNLIGRAAVDCCLDAVHFFGIVWAVLLSFFKDDKFQSLCQRLDGKHSQWLTTCFKRLDNKPL